jgi:hypothetical protein
MVDGRAKVQSFPAQLAQAMLKRDANNDVRLTSAAEVPRFCDTTILRHHDSGDTMILRHCSPTPF